MTVEPLEPHQKIELELFRRALQDVAESQETGTDLAQLMQTATDLIASGSMNKDDAIRGIITCLIVRVKGYRDECLAHRKEAEQWYAKWQESLLPSPSRQGTTGEGIRLKNALTALRCLHDFVSELCGADGERRNRLLDLEWEKGNRLFLANGVIADLEHARSAPAAGVVKDGFGSSWPKCGTDCSLHVVRPGKVQCNEDGEKCPSKDNTPVV